MLPDFVALKTELEQRLTGSLQKGVEAEGVLSMVGRFRMHEGAGFFMAREDKSEERGDLREFSHGVAIPPDAIERRGVEAIREVLSEIHQEVAKAQNLAMFEKINQATEEAGTVTEAKGRPFSAELWIEALEKLEFSFDLDGNWEPPTIVIHPSQADRLKEELERLDKDPELSSQMEALIEKKKDAWRDRESRRRLVD